MFNLMEYLIDNINLSNEEQQNEIKNTVSDYCLESIRKGYIPQRTDSGSSYLIEQNRFATNSL